MGRLRIAVSAVVLGAAAIAAPFLGAAPAHAAGSHKVANTPASLAPGARNTSVLTLKHALGYYYDDAAMMDTTNNSYDAPTAAKVQAFKVANKLAANKTVDPTTWRMLFARANAKSAEANGLSGNAPTYMRHTSVPGGRKVTYMCTPGTTLVATDASLPLSAPRQYTVPCVGMFATFTATSGGLPGLHTLSVITFSDMSPATNASFVSIPF